MWKLTCWGTHHRVFCQTLTLYLQSVCEKLVSVAPVFVQWISFMADISSSLSRFCSWRIKHGIKIFLLICWHNNSTHRTPQSQRLLWVHQAQIVPFIKFSPMSLFLMDMKQFDRYLLQLHKVWKEYALKQPCCCIWWGAHTENHSAVFSLFDWASQKAGGWEAFNISQEHTVHL